MTRNKRMNSSNRALRNEKEEAGEDRISSLPDPLLLHILFFLKNTKETVKTCVLSKRWEFLWTDMMEINLSEMSYEDEQLCRFVDDVGRMVATCTSLKKFAVEIHYEKRFASNVNRWINFAIKHKVKDITLQFTHIDDQYDLPQMLFSYSSLSKLKVSECVIAPIGIVAWKSLESLTIEWVKLFDSVMENILSNCPILKYLNLQSCSGLNYLNIDSQNLATLYYYANEGDNVPDISAPHLRELSITSHVQGRQFRLTNVSSVVQATIEFTYSYFCLSKISTASQMDHMKQLLESLKSVEILKLGPQFSQTVSVLGAKSWKLPLYTKLWSLTLKVYNHEMSIPGIVAILRSSPNIKTLLIKGCRVTKRERKDLDQYEICVKDCNMDLVASQLKTLEIKCLEAEHTLTLVQILIKCTKVLEKMVISVKNPSSSTSIDHAIELADTLFTFSRASPNVVVMLR